MDTLTGHLHPKILNFGTLVCCRGSPDQVAPWTGEPARAAALSTALQIPPDSPRFSGLDGAGTVLDVGDVGAVGEPLSQKT